MASMADLCKQHNKLADKVKDYREPKKEQQRQQSLNVVKDEPVELTTDEEAKVSYLINDMAKARGIKFPVEPDFVIEHDFAEIINSIAEFMELMKKYEEEE